MGPVWAALLFLSLSGQLAGLIIFDAFMRATDHELDVDRAPRFRWPEGLEEWYRDYMRKKRRRD